MHPIERLRSVARAGREDATTLAREAASALAAFSSEPAALVTACRALVARQPTCGPVWWLAARVLAAADPGMEAWQAARELGRDDTPFVLAAALPEGATVVVLGWTEQVASALVRRGDVQALVVDALEEGGPLVRWLRRGDVEAELVPESGVASAVRGSQLVLLEATALGGPLEPGHEPASGAEPQAAPGPEPGSGAGGLVALAGSAAAAATARQCGVPVWAVAGVGRVLPPTLWNAMTTRLAANPCPWNDEEEIVPLTWVDAVAGPLGVEPVAEALARPTCPPAPELAHFTRQ
jgi:hypothetical protein